MAIVQYILMLTLNGHGAPLFTYDTYDQCNTMKTHIETTQADSIKGYALSCVTHNAPPAAPS
jgi:hypothetical protein